MALTNILREPQREITEQIVGTLFIVLLLGLAYPLAVWMGPGSGGVPLLLRLPLALLIEVAGTITLTMIAFGIHEIGEGLCNALAKKGVELRPRVRK